MHRGLRVGAVIPARDEERAIGAVVAGLAALTDQEGRPVVDDLVVCDNGSGDRTAAHARAAGARVVREEQPGYGIACRTAIAALRPVDVVLFTDGDGSFLPHQSLRLLEAVAEGAHLAVGSRALGHRQPGALSLPQRAGNRVAALLIQLRWGQRITDLGPYRAIRRTALETIGMRDQAYGWTVEMQVRAMREGLRIAEVPVDTLRRRGGRSKVGGTVRGVIGASVGILGTIAKLAGSTRSQKRSS